MIPYAHLPSSHPAEGKAGTAHRLTIGRSCAGLPEPGRWMSARIAVLFAILVVAMSLGCRRSTQLSGGMAPTITNENTQQLGAVDAGLRLGVLPASAPGWYGLALSGRESERWCGRSCRGLCTPDRGARAIIV
jgi:hypothetical protein